MSGAQDALGERLVREAMLGNTAGVRAALSEGAAAGFASSRGESGMTALMWAASEGAVDIARDLVEGGADVNARNSAGLTAVLYAFENLPSANPRPAPPAGFPGVRESKAPQVPIRRRVTGHGAVAKLLVLSGADMSVRNRFGEGLMHLAARKGQTAWVDTLLAQLDPNDTSAAALETPLHIAAKEDHPDVVRMLVKAGSDINKGSRFGWTPLLWASACACEPTVKVLLELGADPNIKGDNGSGGKTSPLTEARRCAKAASVSKLLIRAGAIE